MHARPRIPATSTRMWMHRVCLFNDVFCLPIYSLTNNKQRNNEKLQSNAFLLQQYVRTYVGEVVNAREKGNRKKKQQQQRFAGFVVSGNYSYFIISILYIIILILKNSNDEDDDDDVIIIIIII